MTNKDRGCNSVLKEWNGLIDNVVPKIESDWLRIEIGDKCLIKYNKCF